MINKIVVLVSIMLFGQLSYAGQGMSAADKRVKIDLVAKKAYGQLLAARQSPDSLQFIGCEVYGLGFTYCWARDANGVMANCAKGGSVMGYSASAISSTSSIYFTWDENNTCTEVVVRNNSFLL